ncbi:MAG: 30S ribosomal protein S20 [Gammaproteobacteria bacterium]
MANNPQARKRAKQSERRRLHNASRKSMFRTRLKQVIKAIETGDKEAAQAAYAAAVPIIDKLAKTSLVHKNKASRHKSRLHARIRAMA